MVFLRIEDVAKKTTFCKTDIEDLDNDEEGTFPKSFFLSTRIKVWDEEDLDFWVKEAKENSRKNPNLRKNLISKTNLRKNLIYKKEKEEKMKK